MNSSNSLNEVSNNTADDFYVHYTHSKFYENISYTSVFESEKGVAYNNVSLECLIWGIS